MIPPCVFIRMIKATVCLFAVLMLCVCSWNGVPASARTETDGGIGKENGIGVTCGNDFWIVDIDAVGQRLFLRPLLYRRYRTDTFEAKKIIFTFPDEVCSGTEILNSLDDGVSIRCVSHYLDNMMKEFIDADQRRKGIPRFEICIPFAIQSRYELDGDGFGNAFLYHLCLVYSYTQANGVMIRSIDASPVKELSAQDSLKETIQHDWSEQKLIFSGSHTYYGPPLNKDNH